MRDFFDELKRRNVFRVGVAYVVTAWLAAQVAELALDSFEAPAWVMKTLLMLLALGFPFAVFLAWAYELTPEGIKREARADESQPARAQNVTQDSRTLDIVIIVMLTVGAGWLVLDRFVLQPELPTVVEQAAAPEAAENPTIAVLPFVNMSADEEQEYFADGLSEELLNLLARFKELRVIGRTSSFQFKGKNEDLREIGNKLGAGYILEGSVRKSGDKVRITAQLINAEDGVHIWSETFERTLDDIFVVQDSIAAAVTDALQVQFFGEKAPPTRDVRNAEAYDLYLKAMRFYRIPTLENAEPALALTRQALEIDPTLTAAWLQLGHIYSALVSRGAIAPDEGLGLAKEAAAKALALEPDSAGAFRLLGVVRMTFDMDWLGAREAFERARQIDPNDAATLRLLGTLMAAFGDFDESLDLLRRSQRLDPLNLAVMHNLAFVQYLARDFEQAEKGFREALEFAGEAYTIGHTVLSLTLMAQGELDEALEQSRTTPGEALRLATESLILHAMGNTAEAESAFTTFREKYADRMVAPIAGNYAFRGNADAAFEWFDRAIAQKDSQLVWTRVHPVNDNLKSDPRWPALLKRLGLD